MSLMTQYHARLWAEGKAAEQIAARIAELRAAPEWKGVEFDDVRVRHMRATEIETLSEVLASRNNAPARESSEWRGADMVAFFLNEEATS